MKCRRRENYGRFRQILNFVKSREEGLRVREMGGGGLVSMVVRKGREKGEEKLSVQGSFSIPRTSWNNGRSQYIIILEKN